MIDLITGANGFIGKRLAMKVGAGALAIGHEGLCDAALPDCDRFFFLSTYGNIIGHDNVSEIIRANVGNVGYVIGTYLEEARLNWLCFVSTSSVNLPVQTPYSRTKRAAEEMLMASGLPVCIIRPYSVTGVGEQPEHLIPTLIRSCLDGELMQFVGHPVHDFVDVRDVVQAILLLADNRATGIYHVGNGVAYCNDEVRTMVENACNHKARIREVDSLRSYDNGFWVCTDKKLSDLGWYAKKSLQMSIDEMVTAFKFQRKNRTWR